MTLPSLLIIFISLLSNPAYAEDAPLAVVEQRVSTSPNGRIISCVVRNDSGKHIRAFVVAVEYVTAEGKSMFKSNRAAIRGLQPNSKPTFAPGETIDLEFLWPSGKAYDTLQPRLSVDYVQFDDGSKPWGPDRNKASRQISGVVQGTKSERSRLRQLLRERGVQAVADDLSSSNP